MDGFNLASRSRCYQRHSHRDMFDACFCLTTTRDDNAIPLLCPGIDPLADIEAFEYKLGFGVDGALFFELVESSLEEASENIRVVAVNLQDRGDRCTTDQEGQPESVVVSVFGELEHSFNAEG